nr:putative ribonuclease H-like domain-containing protein [Tanacetum cinerariifolium]
MTLIEAARTMLADSKLPTTFWAKAVNIACYVQNKVLVVKPHNKTQYELFHGRTPTLSFMRPFGCLFPFLNTIDHLGKFDGKADEGFFVGYSLNSKAFKVFNSRTRIVEEKLHIRFSESTHNVVGSRLDWLFDIDALTRTINYEPIVAGTQSNGFPDPKSFHDDGSKPSSDDGKKVDEDPRKKSKCKDQEKEDNVNSTNNVNTAGNINTVSSTVNDTGTNRVNVVDDSAVADMNNLDTTIKVSPILTTGIHKDHSLDQVIRDLQSAIQTRKMSKNLKEHGFVSTIQQKTNRKDLQNSLFACFLSQEEPKKIVDEVHLCQPSRFEDLDIPDRVYKVEKAMFKEVKTASTPMETQKPLLKDEDGEEVDVHMYRYQVNSKVSHLHVVKRIFRYLKGQPKLGLWYPKDSPFDLVAYTDSDYAGANLDRKSTIGVNPTIYISCIEQFWSTAMAKTINGETQLHAKVDGKKIIVTESSVSRDLRLADKEDKVIHKELDDILVRAATTASSLEAEQDSGNITKTQSKAIPNEPSSQGTDLGGGPRCQETIRDTIAQT